MYFGLCINNETCSGEIVQPRKKKGSLSTVWSSQFNRDKLLDVQLSTLMRGPNMLFLLLPFRASYSGEGELAFSLRNTCLHSLKQSQDMNIGHTRGTAC